MRRLRVAGVVGVLAIVAGGCGSSEAAETVERFKDAVAAGDLRAACGELTEAAQSRFFHGECRMSDATEFSSPPFDTFQDAKASAYSVVNLAGEHKIDDGPGVDEGLDERAIDVVLDARVLANVYYDRNRSFVGATQAALAELAREVGGVAVVEFEAANFSTFATTELGIEIGVTSLTGTEFRVLQRPEDSAARRNSATPYVEERECEPVGGRCPSTGDFLDGDYESRRLEVP